MQDDKYDHHASSPTGINFVCNALLLPIPVDLNVQGDHCAEVTLTVSDFAVSARGSVPSSVSTTQKVCWFKVSKQPTAKFDFDMCTNKKCEWQAEGFGCATGQHDRGLVMNASGS